MKTKDVTTVAAIICWIVILLGILATFMPKSTTVKSEEIHADTIEVIRRDTIFLTPLNTENHD